ERTPVLSFLLFGSLLTLGQALAFNFNLLIKTKSDEDRYKAYQSRAFEVRPSFWGTLVLWGLVLGTIEILADEGLPFLPPYLYHFSFVIATVLIILFGANHKLHAIVVVCFMAIFWTIFLGQLKATRPVDDDFEFASQMMIGLLTMILLSVAPAKAVSRRLI